MFGRLVLLLIVVATPLAHAQSPVYRDGTPHFWPATAAPTPGSRLEPPAELGGFIFGASPAAVRRACRRASHQWSQDGDRATCSGMARELGIDSYVEVRFCAGQLCEVRAVFEGDIRDTHRYRSWALAYGRLLRVMRGAFGREVAGRVRSSDECATLLSLGKSAACFAGADATARHFWEAGGFELSLSLQADEGRPDLVLSFASPLRVAQLSATSD